MTSSAENLENTIVLHNVKHAWLNLTGAIYREHEARVTLAENMAYANQELDGLVGEQVNIGATEWFQNPGFNDNEGTYLWQTAGPDHDFKLAGEFLGVSLFDEGAAEGLAAHHKVDPARLCVSLRRSGAIPGETVIPIEAITDGIKLIATSELAAVANEEL
jgi:hypothetical protein